jgi:hypothetical protein
MKKTILISLAIIITLFSFNLASADEERTPPPAREHVIEHYIPPYFPDQPFIPADPSKEPPAYTFKPPVTEPNLL